MIDENLIQPIPPFKQYTQQHTPTIQENRERLIQIEESHPRIFISPIYYIKKVPNSLQSIYLRESAYERLMQAVSLLPENYSFIVYDGFRPLQVQQFLFNHFSAQIKKQYPTLSEQQVKQETLKYVALSSLNREHPAPHLTGGAIDLTIGDLKGNALHLGTAFDEINEKSATRYYEENAEENKEARGLRRMLYNSMTGAGFMNYSEEWWHYEFGNISWARRTGTEKATYGAIEAEIQNNQLKGYRFI